MTEKCIDCGSDLTPICVVNIDGKGHVNARKCWPCDRYYLEGVAKPEEHVAGCPHCQVKFKPGDEFHRMPDGDIRCSACLKQWEPVKWHG